MSDDMTNEVVDQSTVDAPTEDQTLDQQQDQPVEHPEWFKHQKYKTVEDQAKAYTDLEKKLGSFTGAPEEYEIALSQELQDSGVELIPDDPMLERAVEFAKSINMNQEGLSQMISLYAEMQIAEAKALEDYKAEQMQALGPDSQKRIDGIMNWGNANLDAETMAGLEEAAQSANAVKAIEALIAKTRNAPVAAAATAAPSVTEDDVKSMQFAKDEHGNRRINTDPAYRAEYERKRDLLYGTEPRRQTFG